MASILLNVTVKKSGNYTEHFKYISIKINPAFLKDSP